MKTLIIIKGQLRTWEHNYTHLLKFIEDVLDNLSLLSSPDKKLLKPYKADVLLSCWDLSYQIYPDSYSVSFLKKEKRDFTEETNHFKKSALIDNFYVHQESHSDAFELFSNLKFALPEDYHFACYLTYKTGLVKRNLETLNNKSYDLILELRPDVFYPRQQVTYILRHLPQFGEILNMDGKITHTIGGLVSTSIQDLIFLMTGDTYNHFSKEIIFHYNNFKDFSAFTTVHFEKNIFLNRKNILVGNLLNSICNEPAIFRPLTTHAETYDRLASDQQIVDLLRYIDIEWMKEKEINLQNISIENKIPHGTFLRLKKEENQEKIKSTLSGTTQVSF